MKRECGVLLPVASLPSKYGIGAFSREAYQFVDQLKRAGQQYWQILPLGPTGFGDSPYQSFGAFAGNPYYIDLEQLIKEELLLPEECDQTDFGSDIRDIDYDKLHDGRYPLLKIAYRRWQKKNAVKNVDDIHRLLQGKLGAETREFCFYMAVKNDFAGKSWALWEEDIRLRRREAIKRYRERLAEEIGFYEFQQYLFQKQWMELKKYANDQGIRIIGDIPIYVAFDSADSWAHPELFQFNEDGYPAAVAGCPPDGFSATGQLWGNPLYRWDYHRETGYDWWMERMKYCFQMYDVVRIDHFRGFDEYYAIPYGNKTAEIGRWELGPGLDIFEVMKRQFGELNVIAEDLGYLTPSVLQLVKDSGFPGMKVLEFAFDALDDNAYLPHNYQENCVVYTGTHDNNTLQGWYQSLAPRVRDYAVRYLGNYWTPQEELHWDYIRMALSSTARLAIIPMQDYFGMGEWARINEPSTIGKNWRWRMSTEDFNEELIGRCAGLAWLYARTGK